MDTETSNPAPHRAALPVSASLGAAGVVLGALGAHAWKDALEAAGHMDAWQTAVLYNLVHAVAAFAAASGNGRAGSAAPWLWIAGIVLFSGSLYVLSLGGPRWLGPVTPLGGLALILGWVFAAVGALRRPQE